MTDDPTPEPDHETGLPRRAGAAKIRRRAGRAGRRPPGPGDLPITAPPPPGDQGDGPADDGPVTMPPPDARPGPLGRRGPAGPEEGAGGIDVRAAGAAGGDGASAGVEADAGDVLVLEGSPVGHDASDLLPGDDSGGSTEVDLRGPSADDPVDGGAHGGVGVEVDEHTGVGDDGAAGAGVGGGAPALDPDHGSDEPLALVDEGVDMDLDEVVEGDLRVRADVEEAPETDTELEPAAPPAPKRTPAQIRRRRYRRRRAVVGLVLAGLVALAVTEVQQARDLAAQRSDLREVEAVSRAFAAAYLTYDFEDVDRSARAVHHLATAAFAEAYAAQSAPGIEQLFSSRQTTTRAQTQEVFVGAVRRASARAFVVVDVTATSPAEGEQRLDDVSFVLDLARTGDGWRVAKVARSPQATIAAPQAATTTTAAPAAAP